jgi:pimeloyl-ACP methyl ester carboxylesterase
MPRYAKVCIFVGAAVVLYFIVGAILLRFALERSLILSAELPSGAVDGERVTFPSIGGKALTARTLGSGASGCVVVFPGRHGPSTAYESAIVPPLRRGGVKVYLIAYPGGALPGDILDLSRLAVSEVETKCGNSNVVLLGRSLGSMVAAYASRDSHVAGLVLESTSPRLSTAIRREIHRRWYLRPVGLLPVEHLLTEDYSLGSALQASNVPKTVIFQGTDDEQTPMIDLTASDALPVGATMLPVAGATHSDVFSRALPRYLETIFDMLRPSHAGKHASNR